MKPLRRLYRVRAYPTDLQSQFSRKEIVPRKIYRATLTYSLNGIASFQIGLWIFTILQINPLRYYCDWKEKAFNISKFFCSFWITFSFKSFKLQVYIYELISQQIYHLYFLLLSECFTKNHGRLIFPLAGFNQFSYCTASNNIRPWITLKVPTGLKSFQNPWKSYLFSAESLTHSSLLTKKYCSKKKVLNC